MELGYLIIALILPTHCLFSTAVQLVIGGSWFSKTSLGESGGYLLSNWKEKVFKSIVNQMADEIYQNKE